MAFSRVELCKGSFQSSELCVHVASCMHYDKVLRNYVQFHVCSQELEGTQNVLGSQFSKHNLEFGQIVNMNHFFGSLINVEQPESSPKETYLLKYP